MYFLCFFICSVPCPWPNAYKALNIYLMDECVKYGAHCNVYFCKPVLLEHQMIYFMKRKVIPFEFAVFVMGGGILDIFMSKKMTNTGSWTGQRQ